MRFAVQVGLALLLLLTSAHFPVNATTPHTITIDGSLAEWQGDELMGVSNNKKLFLTWDTQSLYFGWNGTDFGSEGDLFIYLNTSAGGSFAGKDWYGVHTLPFEADYLFWVENGAQSTNYGLDRYSNDWSTIGFTGQTYIGWSGNPNTEIKIPLSDIGSPSTISILVFAQWEEAQNAWAAFPTNNSLVGTGAETFSYYYEFPMVSSVSPNSPVFIKHTTTNDTQPPTVRFIQPSENETITLSFYNITIEAIDNIGLKSVEVSIDGGGFSPCTKSGSYYIYQWSVGSEGAHTLTAKATDIAGNSASVTVNCTFKRESNPNAIKLAIIWHMHQPMYKNMATGRYELPWTRVHAVQEYLDHPLILQKYPNVKIIYNFVPSLMEQIEDINKSGYTDPHWELALKDNAKLTLEERRKIQKEFFWLASWQFRDVDNANKRYKQLSEIVDSGRDLSEQELLDLKVLYFLLQISKPYVKGEFPGFGGDPELWMLRNKTGNYTKLDLDLVLRKQKEIADKVLPLYARRLETGQCEISTTPYYHPILPLLLMDNWTGAISNMKVVKGVWRDDALGHLRKAREKYAEVFGTEPAGLWPSEEAVSPAAIEAIAETNFTWLVTDSRIIDNTLEPTGIDVINQNAGDYVVNPPALYKPYVVNISGKKVIAVFRDRTISDKIAFQYGHMDPDAAVDELIKYIYEMGNRLPDKRNSVITIAADGENWMFWDDAGYENNGRTFLEKLYSRLNVETGIETILLKDFLAQNPPATEIKTIATGSWINGDLETWRGEPDEDIAWQRLANARKAVADYEALHPNSTEAKKAWESIYPAEGSDWFWWYGTDQTTRDEDMFDRLFKIHLVNVYRAIGLQPPIELTAEMRAPQEPARAGKPGLFRPVLDGTVNLTEWADASGYTPSQNNLGIEEIDLGADTQNIYIGLKMDAAILTSNPEDLDLSIYISSPSPSDMNVPLTNFLPLGSTESLGFPIKWKAKILPETKLENGEAKVAVFRAGGEGRWIFSMAPQTCWIGRNVEIALPISSIETNARQKIFIAVVASHRVLDVWQNAEFISGRAPIELLIPSDMAREDILTINSNPDSNIFGIVEEENDDYGPGNYEYPTSNEMAPNSGLFDITALNIYNSTSELVFEFHFREMGLVQDGKPIWNPPYNFPHQIINIYIDIDRKNGSGKTECLEGANALIREDFAWEIAVSARGWDVYAMLGDEKVRTGVTADADWNSTAKKWDNNTVYVRISLSLIGNNFRDYGYVIVVGSQDEYGPGKWRSVNAQKERWRFGGGTDGDADPNIIDMIVPAGYSQKNLLSYDAGANKKAVLVGITLPKKTHDGPQNQTESNRTEENWLGHALKDFAPAILLAGFGFGCLVLEFGMKRRKRKMRLNATALVESRLKAGVDTEEIETELKERLLCGEITEQEYRAGVQMLEARR
ncbi:MAG: Ig-like domain-containing protein [Thermoplasmata archaeon]|nr:Ig-like domain-containing protein [Thermoplasmata archaeon]